VARSKPSKQSGRAQRRRAEIERRKAERKSPERRAPAARELPNWMLLVPALAGLGLSTYLTLVAWLGETPVACGPGSGCDIVQASRYASVLGVPVAAWGAAAYAALVGIAWRVRSPRRHGLLALAVATPGLAISLYLTGLSIVAIGATCLWCLTSLGLMTACFVASLLSQPAPLPEVLRGARRPVAGVAVASLLAVGLLHLHYQGLFDPAAGPEDPQLRALAEHLADADATFYGASWCPHCNDQKAFFGNSAHRLPYVECSPEGRYGAQAEACRKAGVRSYPTWIIDGERHTGVLLPDRLAELTGFEGAVGEAASRERAASSGS